MVFTRFSSEGFEYSADSLLGSYGGVSGSECLIMCSGPSAADVLTGDFHREVSASPLTLIGVNWGGNIRGSITRWQPDIWTSYDPCDRFDPNIFMDPSVQKYVRKDRRYEYIQGVDVQAHECPNTYFFDPAPKTFADYFGEGPIINAKDSLIQAIDIAIRLGFKTIYLAGCDLYVKLSPDQVNYIRQDLPDFVQGDPDNSLWYSVHEVIKARNKKVGVEGSPDGEHVREVIEHLGTLRTLPMYSFDTSVPFSMQVMADHHYYLTANWLRQSRRCLDRLGVRVLRAEPDSVPAKKHSRLAGIFPAVDLNDIGRGRVYSVIDYETYKGRSVRSEPPYKLPEVKSK